MLNKEMLAISGGSPMATVELVVSGTDLGAAQMGIDFLDEGRSQPLYVPHYGTANADLKLLIGHKIKITLPYTNTDGHDLTGIWELEVASYDGVKILSQGSMSITLQAVQIKAKVKLRIVYY